MKHKGFTLIELMAVLAIFCILAFQVLPAFADLLRRSQAKGYVYELMTLVNTARQNAITRGKIITICGSSDQIHCDRHWDQGVLIFTDGGKAGEVDGDDQVIRYQQVLDRGSLRWRAFQNRPYLQFRPNGFTNYHNGNLTYCPEDADINYARQLIINTNGRLRNARDLDDNGVVNGADGEDISCDQT